MCTDNCGLDGRKVIYGILIRMGVLKLKKNTGKCDLHPLGMIVLSNEHGARWRGFRAQTI